MAVKGKAEVEKQNKVLEKLAIQYVDINSISPNDYNANRQDDHEFELLKKSMAEDGFTQPVIAHQKTRQIVDGEHRWRAAQSLGMTDIPVVFVDMELTQMKIATLRHNRARGSEDIELTASIMRDLEKLGAKEWMQDSLQLDDVEIDRLVNEINAPEALAGLDFNLAWEPESSNASTLMEVDALGDVEGVITKTDSQGAVFDTGLSQMAADSIRSKQAAIANAKTEEERQMLRRESSLYRLNLIFAGDEGAIVKAALGPTPAAKLVSMCREHQAAKLKVEAEKTKD